MPRRFRQWLARRWPWTSKKRADRDCQRRVKEARGVVAVERTIALQGCQQLNREIRLAAIKMAALNRELSRLRLAASKEKRRERTDAVR